MATQAVPKPPKLEYGKRPLPAAIDGVAEDSPSRPFIFVPKSNDPVDGWAPVSFGQIAGAINHFAHYMVEKVKRTDQKNEFPTIAYIGPNDLRYIIIMVAAVKAGCQALFISPRNSLEGQLSIFEATNCRTLCYASPYSATMQPWLQKRRMQTIEMDSLEATLQASGAPFPYEKTYEECRWDPIVVLHTSGSTGIPKPIVVRHGSIMVSDGLQNMPSVHGGKTFFQTWAEQAKRMFLPMPLFHGAGLAITVVLATYFEFELALAVPGKPLSTELVLQCLIYSNTDSALLPPALVEEMSHFTDGVEALRKLKFVSFGGGNISTPIGDKLVSQGVVIHNVISSTEYFPYLVYLTPKEPKDWQYFTYDSEAMGIDWRPIQTEEGVYEMVVVRKEPRDIKNPGLQTVFYTFSDIDEFATKDLYRRHPTLPDTWLYVGRIDNVIVFSNGEKLNPITIENDVNAHPRVKSALVVGEGRFQAALFIEPTIAPRSEEESQELIDDVWSTIEKANQATVAHGQIARRFVAMANPSKPFLRAGKGTVQRQATIKLYKDEIDELYQTADSDDGEAFELDLSSQERLVASINELFMTKFGTPNLEPDTEFFSVGVDSLHVMNAVNLLRKSLRSVGVAADGEALAPRIVYQNPTPKQLAAHLYSVAEGNFDGKRSAQAEAAAMEELLAKHTADFKPPASNKTEPLTRGQTVVITGTTGSLGAYMLHDLISLPHVKKVVALNRGSDGGKSRQPGISQDRGLSVDFSKVEFIGVDLSQPYLGMGQYRYERLLKEVDRIIHNAWPVNFNHGLGYFEPHVAGVRHLADFSAAAAKHVPVIFTSSIGTVDRWAANEPIPETALSDFSLASSGYGQGKMVGSLVLDKAAEKTGIPVASIRVGQIAGPRAEKGMWHKHEFLPSLVASSAYLGMIPRTCGPRGLVEWMPVEAAAGIVLDVAGATNDDPVLPGYYHALNPQRRPWLEAAKAFQKFYGDRIKKIVSMEQWVKALESSASNVEDIDKNPAIKLLDTYRAMAEAEKTGEVEQPFATTKTSKRSETMGDLQPISDELIMHWCKQWDF